MTRQLQVVRFSSIPVVMRGLDKLSTEIKSAPTLEVLEELENAAARLQRRWKPVKEVADRAGECWIEATTRKGEELAKIPRAKGGAEKGVGRRGRMRSQSGTALTPTLAELGVSRKAAALAKKLAEVGTAERKRVVKELKAEDKAITPTAVLSKLRQENKTTAKHKVAKAAFSETGPFDCVVIDPPWPMQKIDRDERPNQDAFDYPVMREDELAKFWPSKISSKLAKDCHVFCWTTQKFLPMALRLLDRWSLKYVLVMVWHKPGGFQPVGLPQYNCEFIVYARKGSPQFVTTKNFMCCFEAPRREHSRKPDEFYDMIRRVTGGSRIDIFSREKRKGFAQYGNELTRFAEAAE